MIEYDLTNPSDPVTFRAATVEAAVGAVALLTHGQCAAKAIGPDGDELTDSDLDVPFFMFGGLEEWLAKRDLTPETLFQKHRTDIAAALASFCTGTKEERILYDAAVAAITDPDKRRAFIADWDDRKRSSMNEITNSAHTLAEALRQE